MSDFAVIPPVLAFDKRLGDRDIRIALAVWTDCWQGQDFDWSPPLTLRSLASQFEMDHRTVVHRLRNLASLGYILLEIEKVGQAVVVRYRPHPEATRLFAELRGSSQNYAVSCGTQQSGKPKDVAGGTPGIQHPRRSKRQTLPNRVILRSITTTESSSSEREDSSSRVDNSANNRVILNTAQRAVALYLEEAGIRAPTNVRLALMEHVTLEYAKAHVEAGAASRTPLPLIIHRMRSADPAPSPRPDACPVCGGAGACRSVMDPDAHGIVMMCPAHSYASKEEAFGEWGRLVSCEEAMYGRPR